jgi:DNA-binding HxlR family transcriptional regulator
MITLTALEKKNLENHHSETQVKPPAHPPKNRYSVTLHQETCLPILAMTMQRIVKNMEERALHCFQLNKAGSKFGWF